MTDWILSIEGTEAGHRAALLLAMLAAFLHAAFGALQKGRHSPLLSRGIIDASYGLMAIPTMISSIVLAPKVAAASRDYFAALSKGA